MISKWLGLFGISILAFTAFLDVTIVNTALPFIQQTFDASVLHLQWVTNIYSITLSMLMIAIGKCADFFGRKKVFYFGVFTFAIAAIGAGSSDSIDMLIGFRALQGVGGATLFITSASLLSDIFPKKMMGRAISIYSGITGSGMMLGPFLGGILIEFFGWRWIFWINIPLIVVGLILCHYSIRQIQSKRTTVAIDWLGLILLIIGLGGLIDGIIVGAEQGATAPLAWIPFVCGIIALAILGVVEMRIPNPLLNISLFKEKKLVLATLSCSAAGIVTFSMMFFDPLYLSTVRSLSALMIGLLIAIIPAAQVVVSFCFNALVRWMGLRTLLFISVCAAFAAVFLHRFIATTSPLTFLILPFALMGINWGLSNAATLAAVHETTTTEKTAETIGTIFTTWNLVGSIFLAVSSAIFHVAQTRENGSFIDAFHWMVEGNIGFLLLLLLGATWIRFSAPIRR